MTHTFPTRRSSEGHARPQPETTGRAGRGNRHGGGRRVARGRRDGGACDDGSGVHGVRNSRQLCVASSKKDMIQSKVGFRSEERREGKEGVSKCRMRWWQCTEKKKKKEQ